MNSTRASPVIPGYTFPVKTAISVPDDTFRRVDARAAELGMSRSEFYSRAAERYLTELDGETLTAQINAALADGASEPLPFDARARIAELTKDDDW